MQKYLAAPYSSIEQLDTFCFFSITTFYNIGIIAVKYISFGFQKNNF